MAEEALERVLRRHPRARLVFIGPVAPPGAARSALPTGSSTCRTWTGGGCPSSSPASTPASRPWPTTAFNRCKSDIKWLEAALAGVPLVASPVGQLGESIRHGINGLLATDTDAWDEALGSLLDDRGLGARLAAAAADEVLASRTSAALGPVLAGTLGTLSAS